MRRALVLLLLLTAASVRAEPAPSVAYFSLELASPELRGQRTGGLGVLAMDLVRGTARALAPRGGSVVGVTLLYDRPWAQRLDGNGEQVLDPIRVSPEDWVKKGVLRQVAAFPVQVLGQTHQVTVYEETLGKARVLRLYAPGVTEMLYNGSRETRLQQELLLGRAGLEALKRLGVKPDLIHLNESHTAFAGVLARSDRHFDDTMIVATTHTPVEAGLERYGPEVWPRLGLDGRWRAAFERNGALDLTQAMMRVSEVTNAVSDEHLEVMQKMYPDFADRLVSVQNGVDPEYWQHPSIRALKNPTRQDLWKVKQPLRAALAAEVEKRTGRKLSLDRPIVAFTRRVTEYKDTLPMLRDHIRSICADRAQGGLEMQVVVAGVAHPNDGTGRAWIREFQKWTNDPALAGRFVFVPDYLGPDTDLDLDRAAVQGADVWLTTPRLGLEASGTSDRRSVLNLGIQIWSPDTGGGRDYVVPFEEDTRAGNGFFIRPYGPAGLYQQLARVSRLFYAHKENGDGAYLDLLMNVRRSMPRVAIERNVDRQLRASYLPALQGRKIRALRVTPAAPRQRLDQPLAVTAELDLAGLDPRELGVELSWGRPGRPFHGTPMRLVSTANGTARFEAELLPFDVGEHELVVRAAGRTSATQKVDVTDQGLAPGDVDRIALARWARLNARVVGRTPRLAGTTWQFTSAQKDRPTPLRPLEPLVIRNALPFTVVSGPAGARADLEVASVRQGNEWIAVLRPGAGRRWMTFRWHDRPGGRWEGRDYQLEVKGPRFRPVRAPKAP